MPIRGVILNRVLRDKYDTVMDYFARALQRWDIPLLGGVPYEDFLTFPTFLDFQRLFNTHVLAGAAPGPIKCAPHTYSYPVPPIRLQQRSPPRGRGGPGGH